MTNMILGISSGTRKIEESIRFLEERKVALQDISVIMKERDDIAQSYFQKLDLIDDVIGSKIGMSPISAPGLDDVYIGGPIASMLKVSGDSETIDPEDTVIGPLAGGFVNALMDIGVGEDDAKYYEQKIKEGDILIGVNKGSREEELVKFFQEQRMDHVIVLSS